MYTRAEIQHMDDSLALNGLWANWEAPFTAGNCGWEGISIQCRIPTLQLRKMAMDSLTTHLLSLTPESDQALTMEIVIQDLISEHKEGGGFQHMHSTHDYIKYMRLDAKDGGLWMDNLSLAWVGNSLQANIETYCYTKPVGTEASSLHLRPYVPLPNSAPTYRLIHTYGPPGHYTPIYLLSSNRTSQGPPQPWPREMSQDVHNNSPSSLEPCSPNLPALVHNMWEHQDRRFCWLHTFNMLKKACISNVESIKPCHVIEWFEHEKHAPRYPHHHRLLNETNPETRPYDPTSGNFTQCSFAYWAFLSQRTRISSIPLPKRHNLTWNADSILDFLTKTLADLQTERVSTLKGFILTTHETAGYNHATTLLAFDNAWYWLDSEPTRRYRATLTGPNGLNNRRELISVMSGLFSLDLGARSLADCPLACYHFPEDPPAPWQNHIMNVITIHDSPRGALISPQPVVAHAWHPAQAQPRQITHLGAPNISEPRSTHPDLIANPPPATRPQTDNKISKASCQATRQTKNQAIRNKTGKATPIMVHTIPTKRHKTNKPKCNSGKHQMLITSLFTHHHVNPPLSTLAHIVQFPTLREDKHQLKGSPHVPPDPTVTRDLVPTAAEVHLHRSHTLTVISANVPGLWTHKTDVTSLIHKHRPHILILVDVRLHKNQKNSKWVKTLLRGYKYWASTAQEDGRGVRGVIVAVKEHLAILGQVDALDYETDGRIQSIVLTLPYSRPLTINGVYGPAGTTPADEKSRSHMYSRLTQLT